VSLNQRPLSSSFVHQALLLRPIHSNLSGLERKIGRLGIFRQKGRELRFPTEQQTDYDAILIVCRRLSATTGALLVSRRS
jgi:hypothetical protein